MSTTYGTVSSITIPSDGDTIDAADVNTPLAAIWDRHDFVDTLVALQAILVPTHGLVRYVRGYGHFVFVTSGTYSASTAASPWILTATDGTAGRWVMDLTADSNKLARRNRGCNTDLFVGKADIAKSENLLTADASAFTHTTADYFIYGNRGLMAAAPTTASAVGRHVYFPLNSCLIEGAEITGVKIWIQPTSTHGALPAMMPAMSVIRYDPSSQTQDSLRAAGMYDDQSASTAAYDALHTIVFTPDQNATVDMLNSKGYQYWLVFCSEGHTNALAELRLFGIQVTMTTKGYL